MKIAPYVRVFGGEIGHALAPLLQLAQDVGALLIRQPHHDPPHEGVLLRDLPASLPVWMSHGDSVTAAQGLYSKSSSLNDVTSGSNGSCGGTYQCTAGVGYDGPTGLGTPNGITAF